MSSEYFEQEISFYKEMFSNEYEVVDLPKKNTIKLVNEIKKEGNETISKTNIYKELINESVSKGINEFIRKHNLSKTSFLISIYGFILSKYSGQIMIYTSIISANRNNHYVENMAGMFVSTLPLLLKYNKEEIGFLDIIIENMEKLINAYNNQDNSFSELVTNLKLKKVNNCFIFQPNISNGEVVKSDLLKKISKYTNAKFYCGYGTTEITTISTINRLANLEKIINN